MKYTDYNIDIRLRHIKYDVYLTTYGSLSAQLLFKHDV